MVGGLTRTTSLVSLAIQIFYCFAVLRRGVMGQGSHVVPVFLYEMIHCGSLFLCFI